MKRTNFAKNFSRTMQETILNDARVIFHKLCHINEINCQKHAVLNNLQTNEVITNVDLLTLYEIAKEVDADVCLPNSEIAGSHLYIEYKWGHAVLVANVSQN